IPSSRIQYILHLVDVDVPLTKEEFALAKKDVPLAMEGLALGDEDFFPLQDSYFPVIPLVVLRHNGNASESTSPGSTWTRRSGGMSGWIPWGSDLNPPV
ncbi:Hypothetical protein FKW44_002379, partial [Caligus rogercresseyi]